jgi:hypothetical protein
MHKRFLLFLLFFGMIWEIFPQYIHEVIEYKPSPGQFVNKAPWGLPESAQSIIGTKTGSLSLGAFGGYVIFRFENAVQNHPDNPYGVDFVIFGNPFSYFSEPGIVSVMKDENGNTLPDDTWYELAGSDYFFGNTLKNNHVTYQNPQSESAANVPWTDNYGNTGTVLAKSFHEQPYYPLNVNFSDVDSVSYTMSGTRIMGFIDTSTPGIIGSKRRVFGYADNTPRGASNPSLPDNPYTSEVENSGADGFDISWAIDSVGNYIDLDEVHFIKVHTAMQGDAGWLGEISTEITGAMVIEHNSAITGIDEVLVLKDLPNPITQSPVNLEAFFFKKGRIQWDEEILWTIDGAGAFIDQHNNLFVEENGSVSVTATLSGNPTFTMSETTTVNLTDPTLVMNNKLLQSSIYPNPAQDYLIVQGVSLANIMIYNMKGQIVHKEFYDNPGKRIDISSLLPGIYIVKITSGNDENHQRFVKK